MKKILFLALFVFFGWGLSAQDSLTTLILVRHAERANDGTQDPDISDAGKDRAKRLAALLRNTTVDAIYSTNYKRTMNTALPLLEMKGITVRTYEAMSAHAIDRILESHKGRTVAIVGHSNTTPWVVNYILGKEAYKNFSDDDYGNVLIVTVPGDRKLSKVLWIRY